MARNWGWILVTGVIYVALGVIAYVWPVASTLALTITLGFLLIASGVLHAIHAAHLRHFSGSGGRILASLVALAAGILVLRYPGGGMMAIAIALALYFFVSAISKWAVAAALRPMRGRGWIFASAVASLLLSVYIVATFPVSALWVPGMLLGIELVLTGFGLIGLSASLRRLRQELEGRVGQAPQAGRAA